MREPDWESQNPHFWQHRPEVGHPDWSLRCGGLLMSALGQDLRYGLRQLRRAPSFALTAVVTLALGIGANVVAFGVLNAVLLKPLDVPQPARLYNIEQQKEGDNSQSYPDYVDFRSRNRTFSDMAVYRLEDAGLSTGTATYKTWFYKVSGNYFDMLGVNPLLGRLLHESDEHGPNSAPYVVLSEQFWRQNFAADRNIVGAKVEINKHPFTVIGVAPREFHGNDLFIWPDFWMPIVEGEDYGTTHFLEGRGNHNLWILGRLKEGVTEQQATDDLKGIARALAKQYPNTDDDLGARLVKPGLMGDAIGGAPSFITGIMALAMLVLLAACTNLASLFAARTADRGRELAIRMAVGSSRWHVLRQLLTEAVLVAIVGGALGTVISSALLKALTRWQPIAGFPIHVTVSADAKVYLVALLLSVGSGIVFGLVPLRQVWATSSAQLIKSGGTGREVTRRFTFREVLLGVQIALCTLLVTASFVALRGMQRSLHAPLGFEARGAMLAVTDLHMGGYGDAGGVEVQKRMIEEVGRIPGVEAVGTISEIPLGTGGSSTLVYRQGTMDFRQSNSVFGAKYYPISPGYLAAAGTRLLTGRDFTAHDDSKAPQVAIVNVQFAKTVFGTAAAAVGQRFRTSDKDLYEIVGVVEDGKYESLTEDPMAAMFFPFEQAPDSDTTLVVRSHLAEAEIAPKIGRVLAGIDPALPFGIHSWTDGLALVLFPPRVATACLGVMGLLAAMLAVTGVFGLAMYSVSKRIREFGIRVALGAQSRHVMRSALGRPLILLIAGSVAGLVLGVIASRLLALIVYEATPRDPVVFLGVTGTMILLGLVATWIPARRALGIDPAGLLREE
jgi:predicted permease